MVNKAILIGRLGGDPELKHTGSGVPVCGFNVATSERYRDKGGNNQEKTEWHNITAWQKTAEVAAEYLKKGDMVYIEGKNTTRSWVDNDGVKHYRHEIICNKLQMLGSKQRTVKEDDENKPPTEDEERDTGNDDLPF